MAWTFSILVVANVTASSDELLEALRGRAERDACAFTLLVPATGGGRVGIEAARARLEAALKRMRAAGLEVEGQVSDPDPVAAVHEAWDPMRYDEIVVSTLPSGASRWLMADLPRRVGKITGVQVTHVMASEPRKPMPVEPAPKHETYGVLAPLAALGHGRPKRD